MRETDLYLPLKGFLESQGYEVKGEILNCDVTAIRGDEAPVVAELKLHLNLDVILQAVERLSISPKVYIGVPKGCAPLKRRRKQLIKLMRMLGLGLLTIDPEGQAGEVNVILDPGRYTPRVSRARKERLLGEFARRIGDPNLGGMVKKKGVMTAYRQQALAIAQYLKDAGATKASDVARAVGDPKAGRILYRDVYGWFDRAGHGIYELSPRGQKELPLWTEAV